MRFLHTADLHLKKGEKKRLEGFHWLLSKADELKVDYFVVAGDLFDSDADATLLRPEVREMCASSRSNLLFLPGNHDAGSFGPQYEYGNNVTQLIAKPFQLLQCKDVKVCGVPYTDKKFSDCTKDMPRGIDILIAHGTLYDRSFIFSLLEDQETRYMPIFPVDLESVARYVAMGHLHASCIEQQYEKTRVVYPGSPTAIDTKCVGARYFYLIDINKNDLKVTKHEVEIAAYWVTKTFFVYPDIEKKILDDIDDCLRSLDDARVMPNILVAGYVGENEKQYLDSIAVMKESHASRFQDLRISVKIESWDKLITNPLIQNFIARTRELDDQLRQKVFEITFPVFSKALK
ncbi:MAG: metallophosphoesterase family protein [candidate division WOR-3 bacterium]|jgi:DNA repair exonuclease SbcCD nuclease subunit